MTRVWSRTCLRVRRRRERSPRPEPGSKIVVIVAAARRRRGKARRRGALAQRRGTVATAWDWWVALRLPTLQGTTTDADPGGCHGEPTLSELRRNECPRLLSPGRA